jgi:hypothetical protein
MAAEPADNTNERHHMDIMLITWIVALPLTIGAALWPAERRARAAERAADDVGTGSNVDWKPLGR